MAIQPHTQEVSEYKKKKLKREYDEGLELSSHKITIDIEF